jgi:hypothetical protein
LTPFPSWHEVAVSAVLFAVAADAETPKTAATDDATTAATMEAVSAAFLTPLLIYSP